MTIAQRVAQVSSSIESAARCADFVAVCKNLMAAGGDAEIAADIAKRQNASKRVVSIFEKTAVAAGSLADPAWAGNLADFSAAVTAFSESLRNAGAFDAMLPSMVAVPLRDRIGVISAGASASQTGEGLPTPLTRLSVTAPRLEAMKATVLVALSEDALRFAAPTINDLLARELRSAIAITTDTSFLTTITAGIAALTSSGITATDVRADLRDLASALKTGAGSRLFLIVESATAKGLSLMGDTNGGAAFPNVRVDGGEIGGITVVVSDGLSAGTVVLVDASGVAVGSDAITLAVARDAALEMLDSALTQASVTGSPPTSVGTTLVSMFQTNSVALRALRFFGAARLRDDAVAVMSGVDYSGSGSPA